MGSIGDRLGGSGTFAEIYYRYVWIEIHTGAALIGPGHHVAKEAGRQA